MEYEEINPFWANWSHNWSVSFNKLSKAIGHKLIGVGAKMVGYPSLLHDEVEPYRVDPYDELGYDKIEDSRFPKLKSSRWENIESDLDTKTRLRNRFAVFDNNMVKKRFKVTEQESGKRVTGGGRMRIAGQTFRNASLSGNNRIPLLKIPPFTYKR